MDFSEVERQWRRFYPDFPKGKHGSTVTYKSLTVGLFPLTLVRNVSPIASSDSAPALLGTFRHLQLLARNNWSCHHAQIVATPKLLRNDGHVQSSGRRKLTADDIHAACELATLWRRPLLLSTVGSGASMPDHIHFQSYPSATEGTRTFPLLDWIVERSVLIACSLDQRLKAFECPVHPCNPFLLEERLPTSGAITNVLYRLIQSYNAGTHFNLAIRRTRYPRHDCIQAVFLPRATGDDASEYPASELVRIADDWKWGAPEMFGCLHLRQNADDLISLLSEQSELVFESLIEAAGDVELLRKQVRWACLEANGGLEEIA